MSSYVHILLYFRKYREAWIYILAGLALFKTSSSFPTDQEPSEHQEEEITGANKSRKQPDSHHLLIDAPKESPHQEDVVILPGKLFLPTKQPTFSSSNHPSFADFFQLIRPSLTPKFSPLERLPLPEETFPLWNDRREEELSSTRRIHVPRPTLITNLKTPNSFPEVLIESRDLLSSYPLFKSSRLFPYASHSSEPPSVIYRRVPVILGILGDERVSIVHGSGKMLDSTGASVRHNLEKNFGTDRIVVLEPRNILKETKLASVLPATDAPIQQTATIKFKSNEVDLNFKIDSKTMGVSPAEIGPNYESTLSRESGLSSNAKSDDIIQQITTFYSDGAGNDTTSNETPIISMSSVNPNTLESAKINEFGVNAINSQKMDNESHLLHNNSVSSLNSKVSDHSKLFRNENQPQIVVLQNQKNGIKTDVSDKTFLPKNVGCEGNRDEIFPKIKEISRLDLLPKVPKHSKDEIINVKIVPPPQTKRKSNVENLSFINLQSLPSIQSDLKSFDLSHIPSNLNNEFSFSKTPFKISLAEKRTEDERLHHQPETQSNTQAKTDFIRTIQRVPINEELIPVEAIINDDINPEKIQNLGGFGLRILPKNRFYQNNQYLDSFENTAKVIDTDKKSKSMEFEKDRVFETLANLPPKPNFPINIELSKTDKTIRNKHDSKSEISNINRRISITKKLPSFIEKGETFIPVPKTKIEVKLTETDSHSAPKTHHVNDHIQINKNIPKSFTNDSILVHPIDNNKEDFTKTPIPIFLLVTNDNASHVHSEVLQRVRDLKTKRGKAFESSQKSKTFLQFLKKINEESEISASSKSVPGKLDSRTSSKDSNEKMYLPANIVITSINELLGVLKQSPIMPSEHSKPKIKDDPKISLLLENHKREHLPSGDSKFSLPLENHKREHLPFVDSEISQTLEHHKNDHLASVDSKISLPAENHKRDHLTSDDSEISLPLENHKSAHLPSVDSEISPPLENHKSDHLPSVDSEISLTLENHKRDHLLSVDSEMSLPLENHKSHHLPSGDSEISLPVENHTSDHLPSVDSKISLPLENHKSNHLPSVDSKISLPLENHNDHLPSINSEISPPLDNHKSDHLPSVDSEISRPLENPKSHNLPSVDSKIPLPLENHKSDSGISLPLENHKSDHLPLGDSEISLPLENHKKDHLPSVDFKISLLFENQKRDHLPSVDSEISLSLENQKRDHLPSVDSKISPPLENHKSNHLPSVDAKISLPLENHNDHLPSVDSEISPPIENHKSNHLPSADSEISLPVENHKSDHLPSVDSEISPPLDNQKSDHLPSVDSKISPPLENHKSNHLPSVDSKISLPLENHNDHLPSVDSEISLPLENHKSDHLPSVDSEISPPIENHKSNHLHSVDSIISLPLENHNDHLPSVDSEISLPLENQKSDHFPYVDFEISLPLKNDKSDDLSSGDSEISLPLGNHKSDNLRLVDSEISLPLENHNDHLPSVDSEISLTLENHKSDHFPYVDFEISLPLKNDKSDDLPSGDSEISPPLENHKSNHLPSVDSKISIPLENHNDHLPSVDSEISLPLENHKSDHLPSVDSEISPPIVNHKSNHLPSVDSKISLPLENQKSDNLSSVDSKISPPLDNPKSHHLPSVDSEISLPLENHKSHHLPSVDSEIPPPLENHKSDHLPSVDSEISSPLENHKSDDLPSGGSKTSIPLENYESDQFPSESIRTFKSSNKITNAIVSVSNGEKQGVQTLSTESLSIDSKKNKGEFKNGKKVLIRKIPIFLTEPLAEMASLDAPNPKGKFSNNGVLLSPSRHTNINLDHISLVSLSSLPEQSIIFENNDSLILDPTIETSTNDEVTPVFNILTTDTIPKQDSTFTSENLDALTEYPTTDHESTQGFSIIEPPYLEKNIINDHKLKEFQPLLTSSERSQNNDNVELTTLALVMEPKSNDNTPFTTEFSPNSPNKINQNPTTICLGSELDQPVKIDDPHEPQNHIDLHDMANVKNMKNLDILTMTHPGTEHELSFKIDVPPTPQKNIDLPEATPVEDVEGVNILTTTEKFIDEIIYQTAIKNQEKFYRNNYPFEAITENVELTTTIQPDLIRDDFDKLHTTASYDVPAIITTNIDEPTTMNKLFDFSQISNDNEISTETPINFQKLGGFTTTMQPDIKIDDLDISTTESYNIRTIITDMDELITKVPAVNKHLFDFSIMFNDTYDKNLSETQRNFKQASELTTVIQPEFRLYDLDELPNMENYDLPTTIKIDMEEPITRALPVMEGELNFSAIIKDSSDKISTDPPLNVQQERGVTSTISPDENIDTLGELSTTDNYDLIATRAFDIPELATKTPAIKENLFHFSKMFNDSKEIFTETPPRNLTMTNNAQAAELTESTTKVLNIIQNKESDGIIDKTESMEMDLALFFKALYETTTIPPNLPLGRILKDIQEDAENKEIFEGKGIRQHTQNKLLDKVKIKPPQFDFFDSVNDDVIYTQLPETTSLIDIETSTLPSADMESSSIPSFHKQTSFHRLNDTEMTTSSFEATEMKIPVTTLHLIEMEVNSIHLDDLESTTPTPNDIEPIFMEALDNQTTISRPGYIKNSEKHSGNINTKILDTSDMKTTILHPITGEITTSRSLATEMVTSHPIVAEMSSSHPPIKETTTSNPITAEMATSSPIAAEIITSHPFTAETRSHPMITKTTTSHPITIEMTSHHMNREITGSHELNLDTTSAKVDLEIMNLNQVSSETTTPSEMNLETTTSYELELETMLSHEIAKEITPVHPFEVKTTPNPFSMQMTTLPTLDKETGSLPNYTKTISSSSSSKETTKTTTPMSTILPEIKTISKSNLPSPQLFNDILSSLHPEKLRVAKPHKPQSPFEVMAKRKNNESNSHVEITVVSSKKSVRISESVSNNESRPKLIEPSEKGKSIIDRLMNDLRFKKVTQPNNVQIIDGILDELEITKNEINKTILLGKSLSTPDNLLATDTERQNIVDEMINEIKQQRSGKAEKANIIDRLLNSFKKSQNHSNKESVTSSGESNLINGHFNENKSSSNVSNDEKKRILVRRYIENLKRMMKDIESSKHKPSVKLERDVTSLLPKINTILDKEMTDLQNTTDVDQNFNSDEITKSEQIPLSALNRIKIALEQVAQDLEMSNNSGEIQSKTEIERSRNQMKEGSPEHDIILIETIKEKLEQNSLFEPLRAGNKRAENSISKSIFNVDKNTKANQRKKAQRRGVRVVTKVRKLRDRPTVNNIFSHKTVEKTKNFSPATDIQEELQKPKGNVIAKSDKNLAHVNFTPTAAEAKASNHTLPSNQLRLPLIKTAVNFSAMQDSLKYSHVGAKDPIPSLLKSLTQEDQPSVIQDHLGSSPSQYHYRISFGNSNSRKPPSWIIEKPIQVKESQVLSREEALRLIENSFSITRPSQNFN